MKFKSQQENCYPEEIPPPKTGDRAINRSDAELRRNAEDIVASQEADVSAPLSELDTKRVLHELQVYQVELEMQNDELTKITTGLFEREAQLKKSEKLLRENQQQLQTFIDYAPAAMAMFDHNMRYLRVNRRWLTDYGIEEQDIIGKSHYEVFPEIPNWWREAHRCGLAGECLKSDGDPFERADGSVQWVRWQLRPWYDDGGDIGGIIIFTEDITERKSVEAALKESEKQYRSLFDESLDAVLFGKLDGTILDANLAACRIFGMDVQELCTVGRSGIIDYDDSRFDSAHEQREKSGQVFAEMTCLRKGNKQFPAEVSSVVISHDPPRFFVIIRDISDRKQAEQDLKNSEERYRQLFEVELDAILLIDWETGKIIDANQSALKMYGYPQREFMQLQPSDLSADPEVSQNAIKDRISKVSLRFHRKKDGTIFPVEILASYFEYQGRPVHVAAVRDISERYQNEKLLTDLNQKIIEMNEHLLEVQEIERIAISRDIHDDLGQELTILKLNLEWLESRLPADSDDLHKRIFEMCESINRLSATIQRIAANLRPPLLDDAGLIAAIEWHVSEFSKHSGLECFMMLNEDLEPLDEKVSTVIMRILQEGLTNISRHAKATEVSISLCKKGQNLYLEIADNGCGITQDKAASPKAYGLIGMNERARACMGHLAIVGEPHCGTTLVLSLPLNTGEYTV